jgi:hypothetical protein
MNQSTHLEWVPETDVKTSMSPEAIDARAPSGDSKYDANNLEYFYFDEKQNKWQGVPVLPDAIDSSPTPPTKEGFSMIQSGVGSPASLYNTYTGSGSSGTMNIMNDKKLNAPTVPGYIPALGETQTQDIADIIERENTTFVLTAIAGISVVILGWMIGRPDTA